MTPFIEWWARVKCDFPTVPAPVAQYWLHEHWGHSPYGYLSSRAHLFSLQQWSADTLWNIRSCWCDFDPGNIDCVQHGQYLETLAAPPYGYPTARFMLANSDFPTPIIILDNRDDHVRTDPSEPWNCIPIGYVLMEGHRRFNLALHLQRTGRLKPEVGIWLMRRNDGTTSP